MPLSINTYMLCGLIVDMVLCIVTMIMVLDVHVNSSYACGGCSEDSDGCYYCLNCCCKFGLLIAERVLTISNNRWLPYWLEAPASSWRCAQRGGVREGQCR